MKNKCFLKIYLNKNLGDDLFAEIISKRYPDTDFYTFQMNNLNYNFNNIKVYNGTFYRGINKLLKVISRGKLRLENYLVKNSDVSVVLGGSLFIEGKSQRLEELQYAKKYYIIGSNFGPYKTEEYKSYFEEIFDKAESVSFRDQKSLNEFPNKENIKCYPDIIFSLNTENIKNSNNNKVVFSIIDCKSKVDEKYEKEYDQMIIDFTKYYAKKNMDIVYMSFCKNEGDEVAIERIYNKLDENLKEKVSKYYYRDNLKEALDVIGDSQVIVGSRFHSIILGFVLNKKVIPIIYSDKTSNVLKDLKFDGKSVDIRKLNEFKEDEIASYDENTILNVDDERKKSQLHFADLDQVLKEMEK